MTEKKKCPSCNAPWEREETISEHFIKDYIENGIPEYLTKKGVTDPVMAGKSSASNYGCREGSPKYFGINLVGIETDEYDGVSWFYCRACGVAHHRLNPERTSLEFREEMNYVESDQEAILQH